MFLLYRFYLIFINILFSNVLFCSFLFYFVIIFIIIFADIYHGINGNVSLDRRGELITSPPNRYDLTLGSDKSSSLSRSEAGVYDISHAEQIRKADMSNIVNNNQQITTNGNGTIDSTDGEMKKRVMFYIIYFTTIF